MEQSARARRTTLTTTSTCGSLFALVFAASFSVACGGGGSRSPGEGEGGESGAPSEPAPGTPGGGGQGGEAGEAGAAPAGGAGGEDSVCVAGTIECDGDTSQVCDGEGGYRDRKNCSKSGLICVAALGCAVCEPGATKCEDEIAWLCREDGSGWEFEVCDPIQGTACNPMAGVCSGPCGATALGDAYIGCDYFPTVTPNIVNSSFHFAVAVSNTSEDAATITITRGPDTVETLEVAGRSVEVVELPWVPELKGAGANLTASIQLAEGAYRLRTNRPVTVYQFNPLEYQIGGTFSYTNDASLLLPVSAWTGKYWVLARHTWATSSNIYRGFYAVTARFDETTVRVTPGPSSGEVLLGVNGIDATGNGSVVLDSGDVLTVLTAGSGGSEPQDVSGTLVEADKPVQVIGGHQCTNVPDNITACDHLEESMFPAETLATSYFVTAPLIPTGGNVPKVQMVRILATEADTTLTFDPPQAGAPTTLAEPGEWIELADNASDFAITSTKPILVAQYMEGQAAGGGSGDPDMALAVTQAQYRKEYLVHAPTNYEHSFTNIVAPNEATVIVDDTEVDTAQFQPIGDSGFSVIRLPLSNAGNGDHTISGSEPVGVSVYGYGQWTSYWYAGGLNLDVLSEEP